MLSQPARAALRAARHRPSFSTPSPSSAAQFSSTTVAKAVSPHKPNGLSSSGRSSSAQEAQGKSRSVDGARRGTATATSAATQTREVPSPAFNQEPRRNDVQPLHRTKAAELDDSFVGMSGGQIFHEMMKREKVECIFGFPGGAILPTFDAIYNSDEFNFILPRHEQGAGHMAQGYARASGKPGVVLVTSGPGATNVVTAMQDAQSDGTPLIVFTGQVVTSALGSDAFQEADVLGITRACTKWNCMVKSVDELPTRIKEAFEIATSGRPGCCVVDLPKDVQASILRHPIPTASTLPSHPSAATVAARTLVARQLDGVIDRVAKLINKASKPIIYAGQGILATPEGPKLLKELAEKANIPVTTTLLGLGGFDELSPLSLHMLGMHGSAYANLAMQEADCIIALGARFDDRVTGNISGFAPKARAAASRGDGGIIHFEVMPKNINKVVQATEAVEGDVATNLATLLPHVKPVSSRPEWFAQIDNWKERLPFAYEKEGPNGKIKPQTVVETLSNLTSHMKDNVIITTGVGQHQMWTAQHYRWRSPRSLITSGGLGTMGFGLPSAIGAAVARPEALVIDIDGDASFNMTLTELGTAAEFNIPIKVLLLNNEEQGMVTQWQSLFYEDRYAHTHQKNPDYVKLADSMHVQGRRCVDPSDVEASLKWLIESKGPAVLEVEVDRKVPVLPMVPAGSTLDQLLVYDAEKEKQRQALGRKRAPKYFG